MFLRISDMVNFPDIFTIGWFIFTILITIILTRISTGRKSRKNGVWYPHEGNDSLPFFSSRGEHMCAR